MNEIKHIEDFLTDPEFIRWVKNPDKELKAYWEQWRKANPEQLAPMKMAKEIILRSNVAPVKPPLGLKEEVMAEVLRIKAKSVSHSDTNQSRPTEVVNDSFWNKLGQMTRVAAILVACLMLAWMLVPTPDSYAPSMVAEQAAIRVKKTAAGEKMQLTLADGTKIWMNSSTEVQFPEKFESEKRTIAINGEVYLEVAHDSLRPFIVFTDGLITKVLGTSFSVNTREEGKTKIALISGKVSVSSSHEEVVISPGEMLDFNMEDEAMRIVGFNASEVLAWKEGVLVFKKASLHEVIQALEEWYGVEISAENAGGVTWQFSGEYRQQMLVDVLESISFIQGFEYQLNDSGSVIIKF